MTIEKRGDLLALVAAIETGRTTYIGRLDKVSRVVINYKNGDVRTIQGDNITENILGDINSSEIDHTDVIGEE